jgi:hypothetical protein
LNAGVSPYSGNDPAFSFSPPHYWFPSGFVPKTGETGGPFVRTISRKEYKMKRLTFMLWPLLFAAALIPLSCDNPNNGGRNDVPPLYENFHNYPNGRTDQNGTLTIKNAVNAKVLLFINSVSSENYIGTVEGLSTVKVKLPEEKFYTIVAVDQANYEEKGAQAYQFSGLTYYSNIQPYSMNVSPNSLFGAGTWILSNYSNYWVALQKVDGSGDNWAVLAPNTLRTTIPIPLGTNFDYVPHYYKELKYSGKVIALVEYDDVAQADTVTTSSEHPTFTTSIEKNVTPPSANLKPAILLTNNCDKSVRVFTGQNNQLSPGGTAGEDYVMASGWTAMITSGIEAGTNTKSVNFDSISWTSGRVYVTEDRVMQNDHVYRIVLNGNPSNTYTTTVDEVEAEEFFE